MHRNLQQQTPTPPQISGARPGEPPQKTSPGQRLNSPNPVQRGTKSSQADVNENRSENESPSALIDVIRTPLLSPDSFILDPVRALPSSPPALPQLDRLDSDGPASTAPPPPLSDSDGGRANRSEAPKFKSFNELNWCDREEVMANVRLFDGGQMGELRIAETKRTDYPEGFDKGNYFDNLLPIVASGFVRASKVLCCGREFKGFKIPCDQWSLCSKCAYMKGVLASQMYHGTFDQTIFYHVTLGFDGDIPFDVTNSVAAQAYWNINKAAIDHLYSHNIIDGAYLVHELKIRTFLPLRVNPHTHVIVAASQFPPEIKQVLGDMIGAAVPLKPSIEVKLLDSKTYHDKCFRYLTKAIDLQQPYLSAWRKHCEVDRSLAPELNRQLREFLDAHAAAFGGMLKIHRLGNMNSNRTDFIGVRKKDRPSAKKKKKKR